MEHGVHAARAFEPSMGRVLWLVMVMPDFTTLPFPFVEIDCKSNCKDSLLNGQPFRAHFA
jgi:hypothetical protein